MSSAGLTLKSYSYEGTSTSHSNASKDFDFAGAKGKIEKDIAKHEARAKQVLRRAALANSDRLLDSQMLKEVISEAQHRWLGCLMLPVTLLFFTFYSVAAALHQDIIPDHLMQAPIREALANNYDPTPQMLQAVTTIPDAWNFIEHQYLPLLFQQLDVNGNVLPRKEWSKLYQYNQLKGLVVMELYRSKKVKCSADIAAHLWCYPQDQLTTEPFGLAFADMRLGSEQAYTGGANPILSCADEGFAVGTCDGRRRLDTLRDDLYQLMPPVSDKDKPYRFFLDPNSTYDMVQQRINYLQDRKWLDDQSTRLVLKAYYLNYQMTVPRISSFEVTFFFSRGGGIFTTLNFGQIALSTWAHTASVVFDIFFFIMLLASTAFLFYDISKAAIHRVIMSHFTFVNIVTWLSVIIGWTISILILATIGRRNTLRSKLETYLGSPTHDHAIALSNGVDPEIKSFKALNVLVGYAHILFMARAFISLKWQPRLAVVTRTLNAMTSDIGHLLIVLVPTYIAFSIAGMFMFGRRLSTFATLQSAHVTTFRIAMENQFEWEDLSAQDFWTAVTWVWVYIVLVVLLMLNMVLAIIMDVYQEVRRDAGDTMTISRHIEYLIRFMQYRRSWIPYQRLYAAVSKMPATISVLELRQAFPDMPDYQGSYLIKECFNKAKKMARVGVDTSITEQMVAAIHVSLEEVLKDIHSMKSRGWMGMGMEIPNTADRECIKDILTSVSTQQHWMMLTQKGMSSLQAKIDGLAEEPPEHPAATQGPPPAAPTSARTDAQPGVRISPTHA